MAVEIYEKSDIRNTSVTIEVIVTDDSYIPAWEFYFPGRDSFDIGEIYALLDGIKGAIKDIDDIIPMLKEMIEDVDGEV